METIVSSHASSFELGAVLLQKQTSGKMRPVAFASRSMTDRASLCPDRKGGFGHHMGT